MFKQHQFNEKNIMNNDCFAKLKIEKNQINEKNIIVNELSIEELDTVAGGFAYWGNRRYIWF